MSKIEITWISDSTDCETCGSSWAEGAIVKIDGIVVLDFTPVAACYDGSSYMPEFIYQKLFSYLGHESIENNLHIGNDSSDAEEEYYDEESVDDEPCTRD